MRVALFIPCYVDQLKPDVGLATLTVLRATGAEVVFPEDQTCCGQPFLTAGETGQARRLAGRLAALFDGFDAIVTPSGSCAATIRRHLERLVPAASSKRIAEKTVELCEFLVSQDLPPVGWAPFPHRVGLHVSCHALRELGLGQPSESRSDARADPAALLLGRIPDLSAVDLTRPDECCGFGGIFSVEEDAVSSRMGLDRLRDHQRGRAEVLTSTDVSCLLHLEALARKRELPLRVMHVAEILAECLPTPEWSRDGSR